MKFGRTRKYNKKNKKKTRKQYKKYKGGVNEYLDNKFLTCYEDNLTKVMRAIQQFSGTHSLY